MHAGRRPLALTFVALAGLLAGCSAGSGDAAEGSATSAAEQDAFGSAGSRPSASGSPSPFDPEDDPSQGADGSRNSEGSGDPGGSGGSAGASGSGQQGEAGGAAVGSGGQGRHLDPAARWDTSPSSVAAIGDSITRGFDTCGLLSDCPEASWATGTDEEVDSLAMRLLGGDSGTSARVAERSWNLARTGASVADLPRQARQAARHRPELVTVLIGANDACAADVASMTSVAAFEEGFAEAVAVLRRESPKSQIYVSSVPDLMRLWREGSESFNARMVWSLADICPSMLAEAGDNSAEANDRRQAVRDRVQAYNEVLGEVCAADVLCRYDGGAVFDYEFTTAHLSRWDWFHPGERGQRELAALAYEQVVTDAGRWAGSLP